MCLSERFFTAFAATENYSFFDLNDCQKFSQLLAYSAKAFFNLVMVAILLANQRWSPRGHILKSLALASKVKSLALALASRPQVLENWPVLGSRTALFFELLKFCGVLEKFFGKRFFVEIA